MPAPPTCGTLALPLTSFSMFTSPSTRVLLPSCRKVRSRETERSSVSSGEGGYGPEGPSSGVRGVLVQGSVGGHSQSGSPLRISGTKGITGGCILEMISR